MRYENGVVISEIVDPTATEFANWCGQRGDSMANSSRMLHLSKLSSDVEYRVYPTLYYFVTEKGYVRHPDPRMPDDWKETDSPSDQCLPFYLGCSPEQRREMSRRIASNGWRTGNGDLVSLIFFAILADCTWLLNLALVGQLGIFKLPIRWSDSKHNLELSANSSADVLNWFHASIQASPWVRKLVSASWLMGKIKDYFKDEPNNQWVIDSYEQVVILYYK